MSYPIAVCLSRMKIIHLVEYGKLQIESANVPCQTIQRNMSLSNSVNTHYQAIYDTITTINYVELCSRVICFQKEIKVSITI